MIRRSLTAATLAFPLALAGCGKKSEKVPETTAEKAEKKSFFSLPDMKMPKMFEGDTPEEKARKQIARVLRAEGDAKYFNEISDLYDLSAGLGWDSRRLLNEVLDYAPRVEGEQSQAKYVQLLNTLQIPKTTIVAAAAPRLGGDSPAAEQTYRMLLRNASPPDPRGTPDFSHFRPLLEVNQAQPPERLVLWMFDRDASAALRELTAAYGAALPRERIAEALWTDHVVGEQLWRNEFGFSDSNGADPATLQHLERLSRSESWWMRTYVAVVAAKHPALRQREVLERLANDPHPVVKKAMERVSTR